MHYRTALLPLSLALLALASCKSHGGLGGISMDVVRLYDEAKPDGQMEFEFDRNGRLLEVEADIDPESLPARIRDAAMQAAGGGGTIFGAEHEIQAGQKVYEVKLRKDGRDWEFIVTDDGTVRETEQSLSRGEAPSEIVDAGLARISGSTFKSVERIEHVAEKRTEYHVKVTKAGATYKIVLSPDARVVRAVREHLAEIEIPLSN